MCMMRYRALGLVLAALIVFALVQCKPQSGGKKPAESSTLPPPPPGVVHYGAANPQSRWIDYEDLGADASGVIKASAGTLFALYGLNNNSAIRYEQIFDSSTAPAPGAVPRLQFALPASGGEIVIGNDFWQVDGIGFSNGIAWGISTTKGTFTAATPADHDVMAVYR